MAGIERRAFRIAEISVGDREDALDIVQDAMFKLVERYRDRDESEWRPLFYKILQSRIRDRYRRTAVRNRLRGFFSRGDSADEDPIQTAPDPKGETPERQLEQTQTMDSIDQALRTLPTRQQQAFLLRAWEGMAVAETAAAMGCSAGSVKTHYHRAVHALRAILESTE